ncbi:cyclase family protein [Frateuria defendens]|uniref:cyclase family protein n=1 Tax=Frateuria defendens TaxID=2219559 RepID=UPI00066FF195|nr:cyclase family protein [Frateuria defendens]
MPRPPLLLPLLMLLALAGPARAADDTRLWDAYAQQLRGVKYVSLSHVIAPGIPVWHGFGPSRFAPAADPADGHAYTYAKDGFEATRYELSTDQLGTQLDPPAHWAPEYPSIDELPASYTLRPLAVISIVAQVKRDPGYALTVADITAWEKRHGRIPAGAVVFVRSDWSRRWPDPALATLKHFPGVSLAALKFLHEQRHILLHGHEPLDTDDSPDLEGESWLMHHGYAQAEGVAHLDQVPEAGALVAIGFPRFAGGTGGYASFTALCPPDWPYGVAADPTRDAPLPKAARPLHWDPATGVRVR